MALIAMSQILHLSLLIVMLEQHDWEELVSNVQNHVHMLNFRYRVGLKSADVTYFNALATFVDPHTVSYQQSECP